MSFDAGPSPSGKPAASPLGQNGSVSLVFGSKTPRGAAKGKEKVRACSRPAHGAPAAAVRPPSPDRPAAQLDRFIPNRSALDFDTATFNLSKENVCAEDGASPSKDEYKKLLAASLNVADASRILAFKQKAPAPPAGHENNLATLYTNNLGQAPSRKHFRHVPSTQDRILDAPDLVDDYYLNLLDWSSQNLVSTWRAGRDGWIIGYQASRRQIVF